MSIISFNAIWMTLNICLAFIAVVCGWLTLKLSAKPLKIFFLFAWLLFIPNTIYMVTDILHFQGQFAVVLGIDKVILILEYFVLVLLGPITFVLAMYPIEQAARKHHKKLRDKTTITTTLIVINFIIAFGVVIGRVQRTNSWEVFTNTQKVIQDSIHTITSKELLLLVIFFGLVNNIVYFSFRKLVK